MVLLLASCHELFFTKLSNPFSLSFFCSAPPAKMSPRMSGRQNEHIVPDYPTNNKINTKEALKALNNASGDATNETLGDCCDCYDYPGLLDVLGN